MLLEGEDGSCLQLQCKTVVTGFFLSVSAQINEKLDSLQKCIFPAHLPQMKDLMTENLFFFLFFFSFPQSFSKQTSRKTFDFKPKKKGKKENVP